MMIIDELNIKKYEYKTAAVCFLILTFSIAGCTDSNYTNNKKNIISTASIYNLQDSDLMILKDESCKGDAQASYRLYEYYTFTIYDIENQMKYLKNAALQGDVVAQYNYGLLLTGNIKEYLKYSNPAEAVMWLELAAQQGHERAKIELEILKKRNHD